MRSTWKLLTGATALIAFGASIAFAQDTTHTRTSRSARSSRRIPISKEGGPAEAPRVDTVTVYRTDTLRTYVHDTVTNTVTNTVTRVDTVTVAPPVPPIRFPNGVYFGVAGGGDSPNGALFNPNNTGPIGQVQLGWQGAKNVLGLRADANFARLQTDAGFPNPNHPQFWNFSADAKLQLPFLTHMLGTRHRFAIYGIGGYTHTMFRNTIMRLDDVGGVCCTFSTPTTDWTHENGWNAGGGLSLMWGRSEIFAESRVMAFTADNAPMARQIPIMLGYNWY